VDGPPRAAPIVAGPGHPGAQIGPAPLLTLKAPGVFAVTAADGDVDGDRNPEQGLYFHDTRFLRQARLRLDGRPAILVRPPASQPDRAAFDLAYAPDNGLRLRRERVLVNGAAETVECENTGESPVECTLSLEFDADFQHLFAIRGMSDGLRGRLDPPCWTDHRLLFRYQGADGRLRTTALLFDPAPDQELTATAVYRLRLSPGARARIRLRLVLTDIGPGDLEILPPAPAAVPRIQAIAVETDNPLFDGALRRSLTDLQTLLTRQHGESFFAAGLPWFVALFGRDSLITAWQTLAFAPTVARDTLRLLAKYQGCREDAAHAEEPGKILHELRTGEKVNLGEVPQTPYYGTVDATPLFLILLGEYIRWTGDFALWHELRGNVDRALAWIDAADHDGDGFVDYESHSATGLTNQGWKDSYNGVPNRDGASARPPIALVEIQGYVYQAWREIARLLAQNGEATQASKLLARARSLKRRFHDAYWMPDRQFFAMALERGGRQVQSRTSNPGHALWSGIVDRRRAPAIARALLSPPMFSGWGIRTLSRDEAAYDPQDYQVGAVWPHDNAIILAGLKAYGFDAEALRVCSGLFAAALTFPDSRLPELFAGFSRAEHPRPIAYPAACTPQAWAAGTLPSMLQSMLGLQPDAAAGTLRIVRPILPDWLGTATVRGLRVGPAIVDLGFQRTAAGTRVTVLRQEGSITVHLPASGASRARSVRQQAS
jgi:glycogen debranching enzyme